jgi:2',3'-cyclic-nucleotide 2'-phosphodiesterase (5'-nucleotidase family)
LVVDAGDLFARTPQMSERQVEEQRVKAALQLDVLTATGVDAMVPGQGDLALGLAWVQAKAAEVKAPYVAANLRCGDSAPFPPLVRRKVADLSVVVIGVLAPSEQVPPGCVVSDPQPAVQEALEAAGEASLVVLLSRLTADEDARLAKAEPRLDLIVGGGSKTTRPEPLLLDHNTARIEVGSRGKKLALATVHWTPGADGFRSADTVEALAQQLERMKKRRDSTLTLLDQATDQGSRERQQKRLEYYTKELDQLEARLAEARTPAAGPVHELELALRALDSTVPDHPETAQKLADTLVQLELLQSRPVRPEDLQGL